MYEEGYQSDWTAPGSPQSAMEGTGEGGASQKMGGKKGGGGGGGKIIPPAQMSQAMQSAQADASLMEIQRQSETQGRSYFQGASYHPGAREAHFARHPEACPEKESGETMIQEHRESRGQERMERKSGMER